MQNCENRTKSLFFQEINAHRKLHFWTFWKAFKNEENHHVLISG